MHKHLVSLVAIVATLALAAMPALAAKGGKGGGAAGSSIWIDDASRQADGTFNYRDTINFGYQTSSEFPTIQLQCYQNGVLVFAASRAAFEGGWGYGLPFTLGPSAAWAGGAADCTATLGHRASNGRYVEEASVSFPVAA